MSDVNVTQELDCRGMNCPLPILKTKKAMDALKTGEVLRMISTDPGSANDMVAWSNRTGNPILKTEEANGEFVFFVEKK